MAPQRPVVVEVSSLARGSQTLRRVLGGGLFTVRGAEEQRAASPLGVRKKGFLFAGFGRKNITRRDSRGAENFAREFLGRKMTLVKYRRWEFAGSRCFLLDRR